MKPIRDKIRTRIREESDGLVHCMVKDCVRHLVWHNVLNQVWFQAWGQVHHQTTEALK